MRKNKLPTTRRSITKRFVIGEKKFYLTAGEYPDGTLGEIFIRIDKEGSRLRVYDALAITVSIGLQHGIPLSEYCDKLIGLGFEPAGVTSDPDIPFAKSPVDFIFRWLKNRYEVPK
jgi:ribonucleoside-diphosphate reductase alpha chain